MIQCETKQTQRTWTYRPESFGSTQSKTPPLPIQSTFIFDRGMLLLRGEFPLLKQSKWSRSSWIPKKVCLNRAFHALKEQDARLTGGGISSPDHATGGIAENESRDASVSAMSTLKHFLH